MRGPFKFECSRCHKKFRTEQGALQHIAHYHVKKGGDVLPYTPPPHQEESESYADRAIEAHLDRAMGIYNPDSDWLI